MQRLARIDRPASFLAEPHDGPDGWNPSTDRL